jgi:hypothetical protein
MKKIFSIMISGLILLAFIAGTTSCKKDTPPTEIKGNATFPAGTAGDLSNSKVSLYLSLTEWQNNVPVKFVTASGSGANIGYTFSDIAPGNYYLDVWKDNDFDGTWSVGDFVGWYGAGGLGAPSLTPIQVTDGNTATANVTMYVIIPGLKLKKI